MFLAFLIAGVAFDPLIALCLLIVAGWVIDSWHDPQPWTGPIVTAFWSIGFVLSAGSPFLAYRFSRRNSAPGLVAIRLGPGPAARRDLRHRLRALPSAGPGTAASCRGAVQS